jgi:hypothetical protein
MRQKPQRHALARSRVALKQDKTLATLAQGVGERALAAQATLTTKDLSQAPAAVVHGLDLSLELGKTAFGPRLASIQPFDAVPDKDGEHLTATEGLLFLRPAMPQAWLTPSEESAAADNFLKAVGTPEKLHAFLRL